MWEKVISFFAERHLLSNFIFLAVFIGGIFAWQQTSKEEMPAITFDTVRISARYPGASAEDVEYFVTRPIEEELRGLDGVYRVTSNSSVGQASISVELQQNYDAVAEAIIEIRNTVLDVDLPNDVIDEPRVRVFKTTKKAILDVALYHTDYPLLDNKGRRELQEYAAALENQLLNLSEVHSINKRGVLQEELQIRARPDLLKKYDISFNTVMTQIKQNNIRKPAGTLEAENQPKVTLLSELNDPKKLKNLVIQGGFEGQVIRLGAVADIERTYEKTTTIHKVNGHEAVLFNVVKNSQVGILEALEAVIKTVENFKKNNLEGTPIQMAVLDDESIDVRNRLRLISINGAIGFVLILITLFIFLNKRSGFWVAMGIPFTLCFTMIAVFFMGYTINGTTLAAVIIVMGMIVDDAIVVAENINRMENQGTPHKEAMVKGTSFVLLPIVASILTTCVAFIPLFFFKGHFGKFVHFLPPIIFLMLGASLFESIFILPGHMGLFRKNNPARGKTISHWFDKVETAYGRFLEKILSKRGIIFVVFAVLLISAGWIMTQKMKFVMFPREETRDLVLSGETPPGTKRRETARRVRAIEDVFIPYIGKEVVGFRTQIASSRRGSAAEENKFRMIIEILPKEKRDKSADQLIKEFEAQFKDIKGFKKLRFRKSRWGQESGSPIELIVQENNDEKRARITERLAQKMREHPALKNIEIEDGMNVPEYRVTLNREKIKRLSINPVDVSSTFRAALEGIILYEYTDGDKDIHVRFTIVDEAKDDIEKVLDLPVENKGKYLVPLRNIVSVKKVVSPNTIARRDLKRTTLIYADMNKEEKTSPVDLADEFETNVFPEILSEYPTSNLSFGGEVQDTRESKADFKNAVLLAIFLIYIILAVLFNSLAKPLIIMLAIPFGMVGIILAFYLHGKVLFGFFAAVGALGLAGVVINDSIIMLVKLDKEFDPTQPPSGFLVQIARIARTRLRAVILTTVTTVVGVFPTAYGLAGYDAMLAEMMLALTWGMIFGTVITLVLIPSVYSLEQNIRYKFRRIENG